MTIIQKESENCVRKSGKISDHGSCTSRPTPPPPPPLPICYLTLRFFPNENVLDSSILKEFSFR